MLLLWTSEALRSLRPYVRSLSEGLAQPQQYCVLDLSEGLAQPQQYCILDLSEGLAQPQKIV